MRRALCLVGVAALLCSTPASAISTNEILSAYGKGDFAITESIKKPVVPTPEELEAVQNAIREAETSAVYNAIVESYSTKHLDKEIKTIMADAEQLAEEVSDGIDLPLEELLAKEASYNELTKKMNTYITANAFESPGTADAPEVDLDALREKEASMLQAIAASEAPEEEQPSAPSIGDVSFYPLLGMYKKVNSNFGYRSDPVGQKGWSLHSGIDLKAATGTKVGAWFNGTVVKAGWDRNSGYYVWLDHGSGIRSFYCHLSKILVNSKQSVKQGDVIALSGGTGARCTGPHLHLGLKINGSWVDPWVLLQ